MEFEGDGRDTTAEFLAKYEKGVQTYAIFYNPDDYPGKYVVRGYKSFMSHVENDEPPLVVDTLEAARAAIPAGFVQTARSLMDPLSLVECWV